MTDLGDKEYNEDIVFSEVPCQDVQTKMSIVERNRRIAQGNIVEEEVHIKTFLGTGKFAEGTTFKRLRSGRNSLWEITCPICSNDGFVKEGLCKGKFYSRQQQLSQGYRPCRCSHAYRKTAGQTKYLLEQVLVSRGDKFLKFEDENTSPKSKDKFFWMCSKGHLNHSRIANVMIKHSKCKHCAQELQATGRGFFIHRQSEWDNLYVISFDKSYIKVGRSFDVDDRIEGASRNNSLTGMSGLSKDKLNILYIYQGTHKDVWNCEQDIHEKLRVKGLSHEDSDWTTETFLNESLPFIETYLEESSLIKAS